MIAVLLYGHLGKQFGRRHLLNIHTPAEAIRALSANHQGFMKAIADGQWRVLVGGKAQALEQLHDPLNANISIVPVVAGSGGFGKILLGAALIGASFFLPTAPLLSGFSFSLSSIASSIGWSMALGGVSQILFAPPKPKTTERPENKPSYAFDGAVNTTGQGNCVPVCYGRGRVGSQVISAGLAVEQIAL
jgi:predicted phage tail protein